MTGTHTETITRPCPKHARTATRYDYARQQHFTEFCDHCGGLGFIYDRVKVVLGTSDPRQDRRDAEARALGMIAAMVDRQSFVSPETYEDAKRIVAEWNHANARLAT